MLRRIIVFFCCAVYKHASPSPVAGGSSGSLKGSGCEHVCRCMLRSRCAIFFLRFPTQEAPKTIWRKLKLLPDESSHGLGIQRKSRRKRTKFRRFWVKNTVVQKPFSTKSVIYIVARLFSLRCIICAYPGTLRSTT